MKKYMAILSLAIGMYSTTCAQKQSEIDSLKTILNTSDTVEEKIKIYDALFESYIYVDAESAFRMAQNMDSLSKSENYKLGIITSQLNIGYYYYVEERIDSAEYHLRKTLELSEEDYSKDIVLEALDNLSLVAAHKGNYKASNQILDSLGTLYLKDNNFLRYGVTVNNIAANHYDQGNYLKAMQGYQKALKILDTIKEEPYRKADVLRNIGKLNTRQGQLKEALKYLSSALSVYLEIEDNLYAASTYIDMGSVYSDLEDYKMALEFYEKGLNLGEESNQGSTTVLALGNIGITYTEMGNHEKAIEFLKNSLEYEGSTLSDINRTIYLYQIGKSYTHIGVFDVAEKYLDSAIFIARTSKDPPPKVVAF